MPYSRQGMMKLVPIGWRLNDNTHPDNTHPDNTHPDNTHPDNTHPDNTHPIDRLAIGRRCLKAALQGSPARYPGPPCHFPDPFARKGLQWNPLERTSTTPCGDLRNAEAVAG